DHGAVHSFPPRRSSDLSTAWSAASGIVKRGSPASSLSVARMIERDRSSSSSRSKDSTQLTRPSPMSDDPVTTGGWVGAMKSSPRSEEHTSELQSRFDLV